MNKSISYILVGVLLSVILINIANSGYVKVIEPYNITLSNNNTIYLGNDGPGQTFFVNISAQTDYPNGTQVNLGWNEFVVSGLPQGWVAENSPLYTQFLAVKITPSAYAQNGQYKFNLTAVNIGNYSKLGSARLVAYVNITPNVFKLNVNPTTLYESIGTPQDVYLSINNTGVSDTLFSVSITGLPGFNQTGEVFALHHTTKQYTYPVYVDQPGIYHISLNVKSVASPLVYKQENITLISKATLLNDYGAIGSGVPSFPIIYEPLYAVMYLISRIFSH